MEIEEKKTVTKLAKMRHVLTILYLHTGNTMKFVMNYYGGWWRTRHSQKEIHFYKPADWDTMKKNMWSYTIHYNCFHKMK